VAEEFLKKAGVAGRAFDAVLSLEVRQVRRFPVFKAKRRWLGDPPSMVLHEIDDRSEQTRQQRRQYQWRAEPPDAPRMPQQHS
jgi:hypothetical protein